MSEPLPFTPEPDLAAPPDFSDVIARSAQDPGAAFEPATLARLAHLKLTNPADFQRVRSALKKGGIRVVDLDKVLLRARDDEDGEDTQGQGSTLTFPEFEPCIHPVDGAGLLTEIRETTLRHLVVKPEEATAMTLWTVFSHAIECFGTATRLAFLSPEPQCGKSTALSIILRLAHKPIPASNISAAATFRIIEAHHPTLLIDEVDAIFSERGQNEELRGIINSGHSRPLAYVVKVVGEDNEPRKFSTFAPMALAGIGTLPATIADRSVIIQLRRKMASELCSPLPDEHEDDAFHRMGGQIVRWVTDHEDDLRTARPEMPGGFGNRLGDNWKPLLVIADAAGGLWPRLARESALTLTAARLDDTSIRTQLLTDIKDIFETRLADDPMTGGRIEQKTLSALLAAKDGRPWGDFRNGKAITSAQVIKLLRPYFIRAKSIRIDGNPNATGFSRDQFDDAFKRYLSDAQAAAGAPVVPLFAHSKGAPPFSEPTAPQPNKINGIGKNEEPTPSSVVGSSKTANPLTDKARGVVGFESGGKGGELAEKTPAPGKAGGWSTEL